MESSFITEQERIARLGWGFWATFLFSTPNTINPFASWREKMIPNKTGHTINLGRSFVFIILLKVEFGLHKTLFCFWIAFSLIVSAVMFLFRIGLYLYSSWIYMYFWVSIQWLIMAWDFAIGIEALFEHFFLVV